MGTSPASNANVLHERMQALLDARRSKGNLRTLSPPPYNPAELVDFSSNDYISLSQSDSLAARFRAAVECPAPVASTSKLPTSSAYGPASSRLLDGNSPCHLELERRLATFFRGESALLFNSGFDANAGIFACLPGADDTLLYDALIHASVHDGMRHSRCPPAQRLAFPHNSAAGLEHVLRERVLSGPYGEEYRSGKRQVFVPVEALYSMDGDLAPLADFLDVLQKLLPRGNGHLIVDEAHSTGSYGANGRGLTCALGLEDQVLVRLHTFGKAMACSGGVVLCSPTMRNYFINYARPLIYSTVMPRLMVTAISCSLSHLEEGLADEAISSLHALSSYCQQRLVTALRDIPLITLPFPQDQQSPQEVPSSSASASRANRSPHLPSTTPIIPILTPRPRELSAHLIKSGYLVRPIAHPTVPKGQERVRLCLHASNTREDIDGMVDSVVEWARLQQKRSSNASASWPAVRQATLSKL